MPNCRCCRRNRGFVRRPVKRCCIRIRAFSANLPARSPSHSLTVLRPPPSDDLCVLADEGLPVAGQAHRHDVLLEDDVPRQPHHRHVVPEVGRAVLGVHLQGGRRGRFISPSRRPRARSLQKVAWCTRRRHHRTGSLARSRALVMVSS